MAASKQPSNRYDIEWANYYTPQEHVAFDFDLLFTTIEEDDAAPDSPGGKRVPEAVGLVISSATYCTTTKAFCRVYARAIGDRGQVDNFRKQLRIAREQLGLRLPDVALNTQEIAKGNGSPQCQISKSCLGRTEKEPPHELRAHHLIALLQTCNITSDDLLAIASACDIAEHRRHLTKDYLY